ncbi:MAG: DNA-processing protein DprA [Myxococcota bacterium]
MNVIPGFWYAAARHSARLDLSVLNRADPAGWTAAQLSAAGVDAPMSLCSVDDRHIEQPFLTLADPRYPKTLAQVPYAPPVLFYAGDLALLDRPAVAIVGTRKCSGHGRQMARILATAAAAAGGVVVSGMAHGIDAIAHEAAPGATIAVLGHALDARLGVGRRRRMAEIVSHGGLVLSEFVPGTPPGRHTFPQRNRVIAWLCSATVVVEAGHHSGALITARAALSDGRDVFAVPGHPLLEQSEGCLALIAQGAPMICSNKELLQRLGWSDSGPNPQTHLFDASGISDSSGVSGEPSSLMGWLLHGGASLDELLVKTGQPVAVLIRALAELELTGQVERLPGERYIARQGAAAG